MTKGFCEPSNAILCSVWLSDSSVTIGTCFSILDPSLRKQASVLFEIFNYLRVWKQSKDYASCKTQIMSQDDRVKWIYPFHTIILSDTLKSNVQIRLLFHLPFLTKRMRFCPICERIGTILVAWHLLYRRQEGYNYHPQCAGKCQNPAGMCYLLCMCVQQTPLTCPEYSSTLLKEKAQHILGSIVF